MSSVHGQNAISLTIKILSISKFKLVYSAISNECYVYYAYCIQFSKSNIENGNETTEINDGNVKHHGFHTYMFTKFPFPFSFTHLYICNSYVSSEIQTINSHKLI